MSANTDYRNIVSGASSPSKGLFQKVTREGTLATKATDQLEALIVDNHFQPGERFPTERDLAERLGVSRTVVREAVRSLVAKGLLDVKPGSGTRVKKPSVESVIQALTLYLRKGQPDLDYKEVIEVRRLLEVEIAGLAAERRTEEDLKILEQNLEETLKIKKVDRKRFIELDIGFHSALAAATHNELISLLLDSVTGTMVKVRELGYEVSNPSLDPYRLHSAIFKQVKQGNVSGSRHAMLDHLIEAEQTMLEALALRADREARTSFKKNGKTKK